MRCFHLRVIDGQAKSTKYLILIKDEVFSENVSMTQALQHRIHEASVSMIAQANHARRGVWWPNVCVDWRHSIIFGIVGLQKKAN